MRLVATHEGGGSESAAKCSGGAEAPPSLQQLQLPQTQGRDGEPGRFRGGEKFT